MADDAHAVMNHGPFNTGPKLKIKQKIETMFTLIHEVHLAHLAAI